MNPYQPPDTNSAPLPSEGESDRLERLRRFVGTYYQIPGWIAVATTVGSVATAYWTDYLHFDISFLLWFWLGSSLKAGSPTARRWAIAIFILVSAFSILIFATQDPKARFGNLEFGKSHPAFFAIVGTIWLIFAIPGIALLSPTGRRAFAKSWPERKQIAAADRL